MSDPTRSEPIIERMAIGFNLHPQGHFVAYGESGPAGYPWRTDLPTRLDSAAGLKWPIFAEFSGLHNRRQVWFWDGRFRSMNGSIQGVPLRWFYLRLAPEVWNAALGQWSLPDGTVPVAAAPSVIPPLLQGEVDLWLRHFPRGLVMDAMDASLAHMPDIGAPEE